MGNFSFSKKENKSLYFIVEIVKQTKENECGVCVVNMLTNHFHKKTDKADILEKSSLNEEGMTIYDFEILANQFGIKTDSYNSEWDHFKNYKTNNFLVVLINNAGVLHFVIVKKNKNIFKIYDPDKGYYEISYSKMKEIYANLVILVERGDLKDFIVKSEDLIFRFVRVKYLLVLFVVQILTLSFSLFCAFFLNLVIKFAIDDESVVNLVVLCTIFAFFYIFNFLGEYILQIYNGHEVKKMYGSLFNQLTESLSQKNNSFYHKIDLSILFSIDSEISVISNFVLKEYNILMNNIILIFVLTLLIGLISPWFLIVVLINVCFIIIITFINNIYKNNMINDSMKLNNFSNSNLQKMYTYLKEEFNYNNYEYILKDVKKSCYGFLEIFKNNNYFMAQSNLFSNIFSMIGEIILIFSASFMIISQKSLGVETLILVINLILMFNTSANGLCGFYNKKILFRKCCDDYSNVIKIGNIDHKNEKIDSLKKIKNIKLTKDDKTKIIKNFSSFSANDELFQTLLNSVTRKDCESVCSINDVAVEWIKYDWILKNIVLINPLTKTDPTEIIKTLSRKSNFNNLLIAEGIKCLNKNLTDSNLKIGDYQFLNLLNLINSENKIILLNDCTKYLNKKQEAFFKKKLLRSLKNKNFLVFAGAYDE